MLRVSIFTFFVLLFSVNLFAQTFPKTAVILERKQVTPTREMVLWMTSPTKNPRSPVDEIYTCPEETRGHYYSGKTSVSLIDSRTKKIVNTLEIAVNDPTDGNNSLDLPYLIHDGYYSVPKVDKNKEGKPIILNLKDYNNDGKAQEFAIFDALACMGLNTTLVGYSENQDKVIQYPIEISLDGDEYETFWLDDLFGHKPNKQGVWKYEIDYRGRGGALEKYEIRYDKKRETFYGKQTNITEDESKLIIEKERPSK
ncbi:MAG TPA: hypothetical protein PKY59_21190 [Pyrinomonadaceae bacterium]|nr:hypothetical protein [Pyrinomonadaceae bacterium]